MRKIFIVLALCIYGLILATPLSSFALVIGDGTISFNFGTNPHATQQFVNFSVGDYPGSYTYGTLNGANGTVTDGHSTASVSGIDNLVFNAPGPSSSFSFSSQAPSAGTTGTAQADISGYHLYGGGFYGSNRSNLPAFSYTYNFNGHVDSSNDIISFVTQMEIAYYDPSDNDRKTILYSDYDPSAPGYGTKMVWLRTPDQNGNLSQSGTVSFGPFDAGKDVRWNISWNFMGTGYDELPGGNPVPIPGAILLFAPGLAGLAILRRRFKK